MNKLRDAAQQALEALENCGSEYGHRCSRCDSEVDEGGKVVATLRAALAEPQPEPVAFTFAGLTVREIQIPAGMTVRIDRDAIIVARQRDQNDPLIVEPQHDPRHLPYAALAEPQPEPVAWRVRRDDGQYELYFVKAMAKRAAECYIKPPQVEPLYTHPPQRQPLSDEEIDALELPESGKGTVRDLVRIVEHAHGIGGAT